MTGESRYDAIAEASGEIGNLECTQCELTLNQAVLNDAVACYLPTGTKSTVSQ